jgi:hypothetical protein
MKSITKLLSVALVAVLVLSGCKKTVETPAETPWFEAENQQRSLMLNFTATWCTYCGQWGHPAFHAAEDMLGDKALPFAVQASGSELIAYQYKPGNDTPYVSRHLPDFVSSLNGITVGGYPTLCVNNVGGYGPGSQNTMKDAATAFNANAPVANINFGISKTPMGFVAKTTTKFFKETSGDYYINMFITENGIINRQNVSGTYVDPYTHNDIIRAFPISNGKEGAGSLAGMNKTWGEPIATGNIAAGKFCNVELNFVADNKTTLLPATIRSFTWDQGNTANLYITALIWKKDASGKFTFVNGVRKPL